MDARDLETVQRHLGAMFEELLAARRGDGGQAEHLPGEEDISRETLEASSSDDELAAAAASLWRLADQRTDETYSWPEGLDEYASFRIFDCTNAPLGQYAIGKVLNVEREYWGQRRPYYVVFKLGAGGGSKQPIAVFVAADDFEQTADYVAVIRGAGGPRGQRMFSPDQVPPTAYDELSVVTFRDRVAGTPRFSGFNRLAVAANEEDVETMLRHAAIQVFLRHRSHETE
ncbi:MAG: hypothetical protein ACRDPV_12355 [Gaiellaceae bacterium]